MAAEVFSAMALGRPFDLLPYSLLLLRYCQCWNGCSSDLFTCWDDGQKCCVLISFHAASHCKVVVNMYIYIYIYTLQVKDLVKLGLLTLLKRTYYYLMRTYYYLDLLGPKLR